MPSQFIYRIKIDKLDVIYPRSFVREQRDGDDESNVYGSTLVRPRGGVVGFVNSKRFSERTSTLPDTYARTHTHKRLKRKGRKGRKHDHTWATELSSQNPADAKDC